VVDEPESESEEREELPVLTVREPELRLLSLLPDEVPLDVPRSDDELREEPPLLPPELREEPEPVRSDVDEPEELDQESSEERVPRSLPRDGTLAVARSDSHDALESPPREVRSPAAATGLGWGAGVTSTGGGSVRTGRGVTSSEASAAVPDDASATRSPSGSSDGSSHRTPMSPTISSVAASPTPSTMRFARRVAA